MLKNRVLGRMGLNSKDTRNPQNEASVSELRFGCVGTYVPQACGIATFTHDLCQAIQEETADPQCCQVIAMSDSPQSLRYAAPVRFVVGQEHAVDYDTAADLLNMRGLDLLLIQHEFGIYGGPAGEYLLRMLRKVQMPVVTTLHTVLEAPADDYRRVTEELIRLSDRLVVMSYRGGELLQEVYGVPAAKIEFIPHGIPDLPFVDSCFYKDRLGVMGRRVMLTFGLLSPGKGIEYVIQAMPELSRRYPDLIYVVLGATHDKVKQQFGESYRESLEQLVATLGVGDHVRFIDRYVELDELCEMLSLADLYVTPYLGEQQIVSGTLAYAMGAGKAIVSTPYAYAKEVLAGDRGLLVPFRDHQAIARSVGQLLDDEVKCQSVRKNAYSFSRKAVWREVARAYVELFRQVCTRPSIRRHPGVDQHDTGEGSNGATSVRLLLPQLNYDHLLTLTDDTGILQHAQYTLPDRQHGYCTDDNARGLVVALRAYKAARSPAMLRLVRIYLSFLRHAFDDESSRFRNFLSYSRRWHAEEGSEDSHCRALWGLGFGVSWAPDDGLRTIALDLFDRGLPTVTEFTSVRSWAFALVGIHAYLRRYSGDNRVRCIGETLVTKLYGCFEPLEGRSTEWVWPEDQLTYANGKLPEALLLSGQWLGRSDLIDMGVRSLRWLLEVQTDEDGMLSPVGNHGWFPRSGEKAQFDQQPLEAHALLEASVAAYQVTGESRWLVEARRCFDWFLGRNVLGRPVYDAQTGGCRDGLHEDRPNENEGAESTLAWLMSLQTLHALPAPPAKSAARVGPAVSVDH